jgi:hypothetical protein
VCGNGIDDDGNGVLDCGDPACAMLPECNGGGALMCPTFAAPGVLGTVIEFSLTADLVSGNSSDCGGLGPEVSLLWQAPTSGRFRFSTEGTEIPVTLYITNGCNGDSFGCVSPPADGTPLQEVVEAPEGVEVIVYVDALDPNAEGSVRLTITQVAETEIGLCNDGVDNDEDGNGDCADPECVNDAACNTEVCDNRRDDDGDGRIDCSDPGCAGNPACPIRAEVCDNTIDDDVNGLTDCSDTPCFLSPLCVFSETCNDGVDNDGDNRIDCADPNCARNNICNNTENCQNGIDDNRNGFLDCEEPSCRFNIACRG